MEGRWPGNETPTDLVAVGDEERPEQSAVEGHCLYTSVGDVLGREKQVSCPHPVYLLAGGKVRDSYLTVTQIQCLEFGKCRGHFLEGKKVGSKVKLNAVNLLHAASADLQSIIS